MAQDFFTPAWIDAYSEALKYKDQPVVFLGVDIGLSDRTVATIFVVGESGWQIVDVTSPQPPAR